MTVGELVYFTFCKRKYRYGYDIVRINLIGSENMQSIWRTTASLPKFPVLQQNCKTDVLIIGGGITGLLTAYFLHQNGIPYLLLEKNRICSGTTGDTTAKITYQHNLIYGKLYKKYGIEAARMYFSANHDAFQQFATMCQAIECDYEIKDNYVYSTNNRQALELEMKVLEQIGASAKFCETVPLPLSTVGAVCFPEQAQMHPLKFLSGIAKGLNIYENSSVIDMLDHTAVTAHGKVTADHIVIATHFPFLNKHGSYFLKLYQNRSYFLALENAARYEGMFVDENVKGMSFRNYKNLLLLGGGAHRTGAVGGNWLELRQFAKEKYPHMQEKLFWAAQDCMSLDDMPYIGNYSRRTSKLYTASGFCKWGMTGSMIAAMILSDIIMGHSNAYTDFFTPSRSMMTPQLFVNGFEAVRHLFSFSKKRCPHLGCALKWNSSEHSWDCPCHGSRFSEDGKVLDNPANGNLKQGG